MSVSGAPFKLRSTCDACSAAKVKCDKKQPVCDRCRTNGFTCAYSPSRRHGKHPWKNFSDCSMIPLDTSITIAPEPVMDVDSGDGPGGSGSGSGSGDGNGTGNGNGNRIVGVDDATIVDFNALGDGFEVNSHWTGLDLGVELYNHGYETPDDIQLLDSTAAGPHGIWDDPASLPTTTTTPASSVSEPPKTQVAPFDCEAEAFTALHSLHSCTMLHTEHPGELTTTRTRTSFGGITDHMPPFDKVLYFNRAAINTLRELLNAPGTQQPHLALLYMTIVSKVLFWYRLVLSSQHQSKPGPRSPSSESNKSFNSTNGQQPSPFSATSSNSTSDLRAVKPVSFQIGVFDLEDEDQKLLMKGVLLREVRKLESVVDQMKRLGDECARDDEYHDERDVSSWYAVAGGKMQAEVRDTLRQIKEFGAGGVRRDR